MQEHGLSLHAQYLELRYSLNWAYVSHRELWGEGARSGTSSQGRVSIVIGYSLSFPTLVILVPRISVGFRPLQWPRRTRILARMLMSPCCTSVSKGGSSSRVTRCIQERSQGKSGGDSRSGRRSRRRGGVRSRQGGSKAASGVELKIWILRRGRRIR